MRIAARPLTPNARFRYPARQTRSFGITGAYTSGMTRIIGRYIESIASADKCLSSKSTDAYSCVSMTVFSTSPFGTPSATNIFCATNWEFNSIYRELPSHTTSSASASTASSTSTTSGPPFASLPPSASAGASAWTPWQIILLVIAISAIICIVIYIFRRHKSILKNPEYMELRYWRRKTSVHHVNFGGLASWVWPRRTLGSKGAQDDVELSKSADTSDVKYTPEHKAELSSRVSVQGAAPLLMRDSWNTTSTWSVNSVASAADLGELDTARSPRELMVPPAELWDDRP